VRYWNSEKQKKGPQRSAFRDFRPRAQVAGGGMPTSTVAGTGSVRPFLRRFYHNQVVVSAPVRKFLLLALLASIMYAFVLGEGGAVRIAMLRHERSALDRRIGDLERNADILEAEIARLDSDEFFIEKTGRERYGYIKEGDRVYKIVEPAKVSKPSR
jgi:cell division protein FtsB